MAGMRKWLGVSTLLAALAAILAAVGAVTHVAGGDSRLHPHPREIPSVCSCDDEMYALDEGVARCQLASDFLIALAYFSIPLELLYFFLRSKVLPHRWVLLQFGLFIVLCGLTHLVALWTYSTHSRQVAITQTVLKVLTAAVSCATAFLLIRIIPVLLNIKVRELFLQHKAAELDREMGVIRRQEEMGRCVRMLTHEIRSSIDRHTILETTLVELADTLNLENCTVWMPNASRTHLDLTHEQERRMVQVPLSVPSSDPTVQAVIATPRAVRIPHYSPLGEASALRSQEECAMAAVRLPLLHVYESEGRGVEQQYAIMVLVLPGDAKRGWKPQQVEMVEVVADQVAVALSHAAVLEESHRTRDQLVEQHRRLQVARIKAETAVRTRNDFLAVMNHELRTPLQAVIALASILQEQGLGQEQMPMVETILKSSSLLSTLISDVLRFSRLEEGEVKLDHAPFNLPALFQEAGKLAWPMARGKGLEFSLQMDELPSRVVGDEKRLLQTLLNVVGNAVKNTTQGSVTIKVGLEFPTSPRDPGRPSWEAEASDRHCLVRVEVRDTGKGLEEGEVATQVRHFGIGRMAAQPMEEGMGLGLAICQRFVELMDGHIWITSGGVGRGSVVTFIIKLQLDTEVRRREEVKSIADQFSRDLGGLRVMVVDDHRVNREVEKALLEALGCTVTAVGSAVECLSEIQAHRGLPFDAVVLDICMPQIDGFQLASSLHEMFRPDERPLIVGLTARTEDGIEEACKEAGMDTVLLKPSSLREIGTTFLELVKARTS